MKRDIIFAILILLTVALFSINGCGDPTAKNETNVKTTAEGGDASIKGAEVDAKVTVGAVATNIEAQYTLPELFKDILFDTFFRIVGCIVAVLIWWDWREGNLHPAKPKHRKAKEPTAGDLT